MYSNGRLVTASLTLALVAVAPVWADSYTGWKKTTNNRYECQYNYTTKSGGQAKQTVLVYPKDNPRTGWAYYYNKDNKPWARCAVKGNPKYDPKQMYWQKLNAKGDGYEDYPQQGFCPAPADGKDPIPAISDPPI